MDDKAKSKKLSNPLEDALVTSIILQFIFGFLAGMILDGGLMLGHFEVSCLAYWAILPVIILRRYKKLQKTDFKYIKWGVFINMPLVFLASILLSILKIH